MTLSKQDVIRQQQDVAARVLPHMEANRDLLEMGEWASDDIGPDDDPAECGTTLCAAGWTAHVLGYEVETSGHVYHPAFGHDEAFGVAKDALRLTNEQAALLFYTSPTVAIEAYREMAAGNGFPLHLFPERMNRRAD